LEWRILCDEADILKLKIKEVKGMGEAQACLAISVKECDPEIHPISASLACRR
jgi:hypothetical protein